LSTRKKKTAATSEAAPAESNGTMSEVEVLAAEPGPDAADREAEKADAPAPDSEPAPGADVEAPRGRNTARDQGHRISLRDDCREVTEQLRGVIEGVVAIDVKVVAERVRAYLERRCELTTSDVSRALERGPHYYAEASALASKGRADYERVKNAHEEWLESKRTAARMALEEEKAAAGWKKQITDSMVMDQVRVTWPDECAERFERLRNVAAAVHLLEALPKAVELRVQSLNKVADVTLKVSRH
jgi:hypothetical protein